MAYEEGEGDWGEVEEYLQCPDCGAYYFDICDDGMESVETGTCKKCGCRFEYQCLHTYCTRLVKHGDKELTPAQEDLIGKEEFHGMEEEA